MGNDLSWDDFCAAPALSEEDLPRLLGRAFPDRGALAVVEAAPA